MIQFAMVVLIPGPEDAIIAAAIAKGFRVVKVGKKWIVKKWNKATGKLDDLTEAEAKRAAKEIADEAANPTPNGLGKATRPIWSKSFNEAMEKALAWLKKRGFDASKAKPYKSRKSPNTNGMKDGNVSYRIEYDNRFGGHINVDAGKEKGPHFIFPGK